MNSTSMKPSLADRYVTLRFLRWLFSPQRLRILLGCLAVMITLVGVFYAFENWRGRRAWTRMERELKETGQWVEFTALVPPPVPDDQNFAMTPFLAPLFDFEPGTQRWRDTNAVRVVQDFARSFMSALPAAHGWPLVEAIEWATWADLIRRQGTTKAVSPNPAALLEALQIYEPVLAELRAASTRPHARFNIRYEHENPTEILLPHLHFLSCTSRLLSLRASCQLALGRTEAALDDVVLSLYLADTIRHEPILISHLVRCAVLRLTLQPIWEGLARKEWSTEQLQTLQARLANLELWTDADRAITAERAAGNRIIDLLRRNPSALSQVGLSDDGGATGSGLWYALAPRGWFSFEQVEFNRLFTLSLGPQGSVRPDYAVPGEVRSAMKRLDAELGSGERSIRHHRSLARMLLPALGRFQEKAAFAQAAVDLATLGCALERYRLAQGRYPESLEALTPRFIEALPRDVIQGGPLRYRLGPDGQFTLYSLGWNVTDDGGEPGRKERGGWDISTGDWVWRYPPAAKQGGN